MLFYKSKTLLQNENDTKQEIKAYGGTICQHLYEMAKNIKYPSFNAQI